MSNRSGAKRSTTRNSVSSKRTNTKKGLPQSRTSGSGKGPKMDHTTSPDDLNGVAFDRPTKDKPVLDISQGFGHAYQWNTTASAMLVELPYRNHGAVFPMELSPPEMLYSMDEPDTLHAMSQPTFECTPGSLATSPGLVSPVPVYSHSSLEFHDVPEQRETDTSLGGFTPHEYGVYSTVTRAPQDEFITSCEMNRTQCFDDVATHAMARQDSSAGCANSSTFWQQEGSLIMDDSFVPDSHAMTPSSSAYGYPPGRHCKVSQSEAPIAGSVLEDMSWRAPFEPTDSGNLTPPGLNDGLCLLPASYPLEQSTVRTSRVMSKPSINRNEMWSPPHDQCLSTGHIGVPFPYQVAARRTSDGESTAKARSDPLYKAVPGKDDHFHCPFEKDGCRHAPEKLKCNYDKHLDSHLKPYKCKWCDNNGLSFSSTACLLRHEREAHGLHGHGNNPYACYFSNCERAQPEKGFPRQWNLRDHMKRVHNYIVPDAPSRNGYPSPPASPDALGPSRRKKSTDTAKPSGTRKPKANTSSKTLKAQASGIQEALKADIDKLSPRELARLQRCRDQGRDLFKEVFHKDVY